MNATLHHTPVAPAALLDLINAGWTTQALAAACELGLPEKLGAQAKLVDLLARELNVDADALQRLLHALATLDVCRDDGAGGYTLGPLGEWLRADAPGGLHHWARLNGGPLWARWGTLTERVRAGSRSTQGNRSTERFNRLDTDPAEARLFHRAMVELSARTADQLARSLGVLGQAVVIDMGGGAGELLATVLAHHPAARGVLFDLPPALAHANEPLRRHAVQARCRLQPGSFFDPWPEDGDVYLLKSVLHDWDDDHALALLRRARQVLRPGARLVLVDRLRADRAAASAVDRATARTDLNMLVALSGLERRQQDFERLLDSSALTLHDVQPLDGGLFAIEARAA